MSPNLPEVPYSEFLFYQTESGQIRIQVRTSGETVWLSLNQMAELFDRDKSVISKHIANVFKEGELERDRTVANFATVQMEGERAVERLVDYYNLDVIISVGYRVKSHRGTQFRIWATERLREYIVKGFTMDDERLKQDNGGNYFDELLARIRDIRSSEKIFWRKVLDIYATSIDYDSKTKESLQFFKIVQNKIHWAAHGHTAAEIIASRSDATKPNMGLTSWKGNFLTRTDTSIAKNYLTPDELDTLNRVVAIYLDFAELQAKNRKPMYMKNWIQKLDDFLKISDLEILGHAGRISHEQALEKAEQEYDKYQRAQIQAPSKVERDFDEAMKHVGAIEKGKLRKRGT
ncbi:MAG: virulence RhuM family protein [Bdellovibrionota bacterium]